MTGSRNPFDDLERLFDELRRTFETSTQLPESASVSRGLPGTTSVNVDLEDRDDELLLTAELPGFDEDDIDLRVTDHTLHLDADHEEETSEEEDGEFVRRERRRASVSRSIRLPEAVDVDDISATCNNGILTVQMPKREPGSEGTQIDVE